MSWYYGSYNEMLFQVFISDGNALQPWVFDKEEMKYLLSIITKIDNFIFIISIKERKVLLNIKGYEFFVMCNNEAETKRFELKKSNELRKYWMTSGKSSPFL